MGEIICMKTPPFFYSGGAMQTLNERRLVVVCTGSRASLGVLASER